MPNISTAPTVEFRWLVFYLSEHDGSHPSAILHGDRQAKVLQQKHVSFFEGVADVWKDIPIEGI